MPRGRRRRIIPGIVHPIPGLLPSINGLVYCGSMNHFQWEDPHTPCPWVSQKMFHHVSRVWDCHFAAIPTFW